MIKDSDFSGTVYLEKKKRVCKPQMVLRLSYQDWNAVPDRAGFVLKVAEDWARAGRDPLRLYVGRKPGPELTRAALEEKLAKRRSWFSSVFRLKSSLRDTGDWMGFLFKNVTRDYWEKSLSYCDGETAAVIAGIPMKKMTGLAPYAPDSMLAWMRGMCPPDGRVSGRVWIDSEEYGGPDWELRRKPDGTLDRRPALNGDWLELMPEDRLEAWRERYGGEARFCALCRANGLFLERWDCGWALRMSRPLEDTPEFYDDLRRVSRALFEAAPPLEEKERTI